jgi:hypothetical protein
VSEFGARLAETKECMEELTGSVPVQARLASLWEEQAKEWSRSSLPPAAAAAAGSAGRAPEKSEKR